MRSDSQSKLDHILSELIIPLSDFADLLLDFRSWAQTGEKAGACVKAYFEMVEAAPENGSAAVSLEDLRKWLESHLEISIMDGLGGRDLETLPCQLGGHAGLQHFCRSAMETVRQDRAWAASQLHLQLRFARKFPLAA
ncbi:MAG: hypothetical protein HC845_01300 [Akkermansiaceae bacterium]|nr:hypothetical protein [Akkermansiaceae bacterium]